MSELAKLIQKSAGTYGKDNVLMLACTVDSASEADRNCMVTPINDNIASFPARLMSEIDDGLLIIPTAGSTVNVLFSNQNAPIVVQFSQIDKIFIVAGGSTFLIYGSGIELDGNKYGGIPEVEELTKKYNALEKDLNDLKRIFSSWVVSPGDGGAALFGLLATYKTKTFTLTKRADIENTKVQHGDGS